MTIRSALLCESGRRVSRERTTPLSRWRFIACLGMGGWLAVVTATRALAQGSPPALLDAVGEARWLPWAYRDPLLMKRLAVAGLALKAGDAVVAVQPESSDQFWYLVMTEYGLPEQVIVAATQARPALRTIRIEMTDGEVRVRPRPDRSSASGSR